MAKFKGKGVVIAGLLAGAASFLSKKENRDKAMEYLNQAKQKVDESGGVQGLMDKVKSNGQSMNQTTKEGPAGAMAAQGADETYVEESLQDVASTAGDASDPVLEGNHMIDEGGVQIAVDMYNEEQEQNHNQKHQ